MSTKDKNTQEFSLENFKLDPISSLDSTRSNLIAEESDENIQSIDNQLQSASTDSIETETPEQADELSVPDDSICKELSAPKLPELKKENRA